MTLSFSRKNISDLDFKNKIWSSLVMRCGPNEYGEWLMEYGLDSEKVLSAKPKIHTIRRGNRWRKGMKIHLVQDNRTANRFQFAPTINCKSVQEFKIKWSWEDVDREHFCVNFDGNPQDLSGVEQIAINDGFNSIEGFLEYFDSDFEGQIIHWTDHRYK